jgi:hypothetical protein
MRLNFRAKKARGQVLVVIAIFLFLGVFVAGVLVNAAYLRNNGGSLATGALRNSSLSALQHVDPCLGFGRYYIKIEDHPTEPGCNNGPDGLPLPLADTVLRQFVYDNLLLQEQLYGDVSIVLSDAGTGGGSANGLDVEIINFDPSRLEHVTSFNNVPYDAELDLDGNVVSQLTGRSYDHSVIAVRLRLSVLQLNQDDYQYEEIMAVQAGER